MPGDILSLTAAIFLFTLLPDAALTQPYDTVGDSDTDSYPTYQTYGQSADPSGVETNGPTSGGLSLAAIFNTRVRDISEMCPRQNVLLFFATGNINYLRACLPRRNDTTGSGLPSQEMESRHAQEAEPVAETYSGRLLKRILQNMGAGTVKVNVPAAETQHATEKRTRLSVGGPMASLVDMLRQESRGHRRPLSAFHQELLHMG